jgi:hypothetical protein
VVAGGTIALLLNFVLVFVWVLPLGTKGPKRSNVFLFPTLSASAINFKQQTLVLPLATKDIPTYLLTYLLTYQPTQACLIDVMDSFGASPPTVKYQPSLGGQLLLLMLLFLPSFPMPPMTRFVVVVVVVIQSLAEK